MSFLLCVVNLCVRFSLFFAVPALCCCGICVGGIRWSEKAPRPLEGLWFRHHSGPDRSAPYRAPPRPWGSTPSLLLCSRVGRPLSWVGRCLMKGRRKGLWTLFSVVSRIKASLTESVLLMSLDAESQHTESVVWDLNNKRFMQFTVLEIEISPLEF